jgi:TatA/E family protein of Tat protein translocase
MMAAAVCWPGACRKAGMVSMVVERPEKRGPSSIGRGSQSAGLSLPVSTKVRRQDRVEEAVMDTVGPWELLIIVMVLVALFGASRLPKMARSLGEGIREFRSAFREASDPTTSQTQQTTTSTQQPTDQQHAPSK